MKKWFVLALTLMLCLSLCACDMEAIMAGLGDMMENEEPQAPEQDQVSDNMFIIDGEEGSGSIGTVITVVGENSVIVGEGSTIEIIDGVAYVDGKPVEITEGENGSFSYIVEIEPEE